MIYSTARAYISPYELAYQVLKKIKETEGRVNFPIDPFKLIANEDILLRFSSFEKLEGVIISDGKTRPIVAINIERPLQRQRFTAAHEYCHYLKDLTPETINNPIICKINSNAAIERYADTFASNLLMPLDELKKQVGKYLNDDGYVSFEDVTRISEYFGVSFSMCIHRIAFDLHMIDGDTSEETLRKRIKQYRPDNKRLEIIKNTNDKKLLENMIDYSIYTLINLSINTGMKFIQNYIYYDNKMEGLNLDSSTLNGILADLRYNGSNSKYFNIDDENIIMSLGNLEAQKYCINTDEQIDIFKIKNIHKLLYKYAPYPDFAGKFKTTQNVIVDGCVQPIKPEDVYDELVILNYQLKILINNKNSYTPSEYIVKCLKIHYRLIVIHAFDDGNGRVARAFLNWLFKLKGLPPIYFDNESKVKYFESLKLIDKKEDYNELCKLVYKRILSTMIELHQYLFIEEIDDNNY